MYTNNNTATVRNVYSVGMGKNLLDLNHGPNIYSKISKNIYNNYYFTDEIFTSELELKVSDLSLWDAEFQNQVLNSEGVFIIDELINEGYYPQIIMPECMPSQEFIKLPEVNDNDLPDILSTKILEQGTNNVKVEFSINNPHAETISDIKIENLNVEIISQEYKNKKSTVIAELKDPIICVSSYNVLSISTRGAFNSSYTREYEKGERVINVDLYNEIWNIEDWKNIKESTTENYMLMTDLNFINEDNSICILNIYGILNGNNHTISNINLNNAYGLIQNLYGTLENLYIKNFNQKNSTISFGGIIYYAREGSNIDNVSLENVDISSMDTYIIGGLAARSTYCTIRNSSVSNLKIKAIPGEGRGGFYIGGIVGLFSASIIENCYVNNIEVVDEEAVISAIGGIIAYDNSGVGAISNCYSEGKINSKNSNIGGIAGNITSTNVSNCYSKINISTTGKNIGGIIGICSGSDISIIKNNLSIGNIYNESGTHNLNRIIGNRADATNNYSYEGQLLNGFISNESKGATLLDKEATLNLNLGNNYYYSEAKNEILPKLYNVEKTMLLPNQTDIYLTDNISDKLEIENIEVTKPNNTEAEINIRFSNPSEVEITGIKIEDMTSSIVKNVTQNAITNLTIKSMPKRYYDSYKLTEIKYKNNFEDEEKIKKVETEIKVQFYKELYTYEDWQTIEEGTYQNYRLMADINFDGRDKIKSNITVNRLEAENNIKTIKNITLEFSESNKGLIKNIKTNMKNINFENINIKNTATSGEYCGVVVNLNGNLENIKFNSITVQAKNINHVGIIGYVSSGIISNIDLSNVTVEGSNYVGGLAGEDNYEISNIKANNINILGLNNYVGGIVGFSANNLAPEHKNIIISDSNISGKNRIGGISGHSNLIKLTNSSVKDSVVTGESYVGGMTGYKIVSSKYHVNYNSIDNVQVYGSGEYLGGLNGSGASYEYYAEVKNAKVVGTTVNSNYVGGIGRIFGIIRFL